MGKVSRSIITTCTHTEHSQSRGVRFRERGVRGLNRRGKRKCTKSASSWKLSNRWSIFHLSRHLGFGAHLTSLFLASNYVSPGWVVGFNEWIGGATQYWPRCRVESFIWERLQKKRKHLRQRQEYNTSKPSHPRLNGNATTVYTRIETNAKCSSLHLYRCRNAQLWYYLWHRHWALLMIGLLLVEIKSWRTTSLKLLIAFTSTSFFPHQMFLNFRLSFYIGLLLVERSKNIIWIHR